MQQEIKEYTENALLPFWIQRTIDPVNGGFITHFDELGNDTGKDEKSLIAQTRSIFTYSQAYRHGFGGEVMLEMAKNGVQFLLNNMWDSTHGGFYWMVDRAGKPINKQKIG